MGDIPLAPVERLIRRAGGDVRVSNEATEEMRNYLEEIIEEVAVKASKLARHAGRKTIAAEDIRLARK